jgi:hypothetical protein
MRVRTILTASLAFVAAGASMVPASLAPASGVAVNGSVIASGVVMDAAGKVVPNADISLLMWPSDDVSAAQKPGDAVNLLDVGHGLSDSHGHFDVTLPDLAMLYPGLIGDNIANFTILAVAPDGLFSVFSFSRQAVTQKILGTPRSSSLTRRQFQKTLPA